MGQGNDTAAALAAKEILMWTWADRVVKTVSDVTVGTVIVLVHVALADRRRSPSIAVRAERPLAPNPRARRA